MEKIKDILVKFFSDKSHVVAVFIFGSYAAGRETSESDIDLAILWDKPHVPDGETQIALREELSSLLSKDVDLVCLNTASPIIGMQVHNNGKILIVNSSRELADYEIRLFIDYAELKELRAPMEKEILKRKFYD